MPPDATATVEVRLATARDAAGIAAIHIASWRRAYRHVFSPEALAGIPSGDRERLWQAVIGTREPRRRVLVAGPSGGSPRGFAAWSPTRDDGGDAETTAELCALYVHPDAWGGGLGGALLARGEALARADGFTRATLWVLRDNPRARGFYEAAGWRADGAEQEEEVLGTRVPEVRYAVDLRP
ncbi:MAG: N-acetyltransferase family protein [Thermoleophilia bacterium]